MTNWHKTSLNDDLKYWLNTYAYFKRNWHGNLDRLNHAKAMVSFSLASLGGLGGVW